MNGDEREALLSRLRGDGLLIANHFTLSLKTIEAERAGVKRRYGVCYADGRIKVRLTHARSGEPLKYSSLIDTLCHELAHLKHFDHSEEFKSFFWTLLNWARKQGIYQPTTRRAARIARHETVDEAVPSTPLTQPPPRRNGVPIFQLPRPADTGLGADRRDAPLPWVRRQQALFGLDEQRPPTPRARRRSRPLPTSTSASEVRGQQTPARAAGAAQRPSRAAANGGTERPHLALPVASRCSSTVPPEEVQTVPLNQQLTLF
jgi:hypothetical protein